MASSSSDHQIAKNSTQNVATNSNSTGGNGLTLAELNEKSQLESDKALKELGLKRGEPCVWLPPPSAGHSRYYQKAWFRKQAAATKDLAIATRNNGIEAREDRYTQQRNDSAVQMACHLASEIGANRRTWETNQTLRACAEVNYRGQIEGAQIVASGFREMGRQVEGALDRNTHQMSEEGILNRAQSDKQIKNANKMQRRQLATMKNIADEGNKTRLECAESKNKTKLEISNRSEKSADKRQQMERAYKAHLLHNQREQNRIGNEKLENEKKKTKLFEKKTQLLEKQTQLLGKLVEHAETRKQQQNAPSVDLLDDELYSATIAANLFNYDLEEDEEELGNDDYEAISSRPMTSTNAEALQRGRSKSRRRN